MSAILLIDDDAALAETTASVLRNTGREVVTAGTVAAALAILAAGTPLAVVLDLVLDTDPTALHAALVARRIPVLLVSGVEPQKLPEVADPRGWPYLAKPFTPDALITAVSALVDGATGRYSTVPSSISRAADGSMTATKSTATVISETIVDVAALVILGAVLLYVKPASVWVQGGCVVGILLLAGVRVADLVALSRGLPGRGGPGALVHLIAVVGAAMGARLGGS